MAQPLQMGQGSRWHGRLAPSQLLITLPVINEGVANAPVGPLACSTMVELSSKVSRTLNKTTAGIQIWRIEVGMWAQPGHPSLGVWGG